MSRHRWEPPSSAGRNSRRDVLRGRRRQGTRRRPRTRTHTTRSPVPPTPRLARSHAPEPHTDHPPRSPASPTLTFSEASPLPAQGPYLPPPEHPRIHSKPPLTTAFLSGMGHPVERTWGSALLANQHWSLTAHLCCPFPFKVEMSLGESGPMSPWESRRSKTVRRERFPAAGRGSPTPGPSRA